MAFLGAVGKWLGSNILPLVGLGVGAASQASNFRQQQRMNEQSQAFSRQMFDAQGKRELEYFNLQNAYNDPSAQMQRLKDAGLNPNLVYGNGAKTESASISPKAPMGAQFTAPKLDLGSVVQQALMTSQLQSNIRRTDAETQAILSRTVNQDFLNSVQQSIGVDNYTRNYTRSTDKLEVAYKRELSDYNAWAAGNFAGQPDTSSPDSPLAKAYRANLDATLQKLKNLSATGDAIGFSNVVKQFEADLARQGISPNSPWWTKLVGDLLMKAVPSLFNASGATGVANPQFGFPSTTNFKP